MKLRNLILAGLAACTMVSCSKDEAVDIYANGPIDASLSFGAVPALETKAAGYDDDDAGMLNEANVKNLDVYIFKNETLHVYKRYSVSSGTANLLTTDFAIKDLTVKIGKEKEEFAMYLVANCDALNVTSLSAFEAASIGANITTYALGGYMPMVSAKQAFTSDKLEPLHNEATGKYAENWINNGGSVTPEIGNSHEALTKPTTTPIQITRQISRIQVESLTVKFTEGVSGSFTLNRLSLVNVPNGVTVSGAGELPWVKTYQGGKFAVKDKEILSGADKTNGNYIGYLTGLNNQLTKAYESGHEDGDFEVVDKFYAYTYPNNSQLVAKTVPDVTEAKNYQTILLVSGIYKVSATDQGSEKHFRVPIETPAASGGVTKEIKPNHIYKVTLTITGQGSTNEDEYEYNAHISAKITVAPWKVVNQTEEDLN